MTSPVQRRVQEIQQKTAAARRGVPSAPPASPSAPDLLSMLHKAAAASEYAAIHFEQAIDDRPHEEKIAEYLAFESRIKQGEIYEENLVDNDADEVIRATNPQGSKGERIIPLATEPGPDGQMPNDQHSDELQMEGNYPQTILNKRASRFGVRRFLQKRANMPGMSAPQPPQMAPQGAAMAPNPGMPPPNQPPPAMQPPPPSPGPNPIEVAMSLMEQGTLTPETLAQSAGISVEEAAGVIASMSGGTSAAQAQQLGMGGGAAPAAPPPPPGMTVQASAETAWQRSLWKLAEDEMDEGDIKGSRDSGHPAVDSWNVPSLPGTQHLQSNEAARNFTAQDARKARRDTLRQYFSHAPNEVGQSGSLNGRTGLLNSQRTEKTSSSKGGVSAFLARRRP